MVAKEILSALILIGLGVCVAVVLILFGFLLGRRTRGEETFSVPSFFNPDEKRPDEDLFSRAQLSPEEGGFSDEELANLNRARPYEGI